jgi:copper chaperone CopZ
MRAAARIAAVIAAAALALAALLVLIEIVAAALGSGHVFLPYEEWYQFARTHDWESDEVRFIAIPMVLVGIALLVIGLAPWRPSLIKVYDEEAAEIHVRRRSVARSLERAVQHLDGVDRCAVSVAPSKVKVRVTTNRRLPGDLRPIAQDTVIDHLGAMGLPAPSEVRVRVVAPKVAS